MAAPLPPRFIRVGAAIQLGFLHLLARHYARYMATPPVPTPATAPARANGVDATDADTADDAPRLLDPAERVVRLLTPLVGLAFLLVLVALPLHALPFGQTGTDGVYRWLGLHTSDRSFVDSWARWNYSGYERKEATAAGGGYTEYYALMQTMARVGQDEGCGERRAYRCVHVRPQ